MVTYVICSLAGWLAGIQVATRATAGDARAPASGWPSRSSGGWPSMEARRSRRHVEVEKGDGGKIECREIRAD